MMRRVITAAFVAAFIVSGSVGFAQSKAAPVKYNLAAEATLSGTVTDVISIPDAAGNSVGVHLVVKTDKGLVTVHVGPAMYIGMNNFFFLVDDKVEVTGARTTKTGTVFLARTITLKEKTLTLRDESGAPAWTPNIDGTDGCGVEHSATFVGSEG